MRMQSGSVGGLGRRHGVQHGFILYVSFAMYLLAGLGQRLRPATWQRSRRRSIIAEAWAASGTIAELAFAG